MFASAWSTLPTSIPLTALKIPTTFTVFVIWYNCSKISSKLLDQILSFFFFSFFEFFFCKKLARLVIGASTIACYLSYFSNGFVRVFMWSVPVSLFVCCKCWSISKIDVGERYLFQWIQRLDAFLFNFLLSIRNSRQYSTDSNRFREQTVNIPWILIYLLIYWKFNTKRASPVTTAVLHILNWKLRLGIHKKRITRRITFTFWKSKMNQSGNFRWINRMN